LVEYLDRLLPGLPLPLYLYNMPQLTKVQFELETLRHATGHDRILGVKDSSGDLHYFEQAVSLTQVRPDWSVLIGPEHLLVESLHRGGHGGVNGGANLWPRLFVDLYDAVRRGDDAEVGRLERRRAQLGEIYRVGRHASAIVKGMKCSLSLLGICDDFMAEPFHRFREPERSKVRAVLETLGLLPAG
jgi:4-hydroxy-tetrahydrodipicolinate synthase